MTTTTDNAARQILDTWTDLGADDFAQLTSDNGMEIDGCAVWVRPSDNKIVAFRQVENGPEEWTEIPAPATTGMRLISGCDVVDIGPATLEQVAASNEAPNGIILVADDSSVVKPGQFGADQARRCWVD